MAKTKIVDSKKGYDLAALEYDKKEKYLDSFEQNKLIPLFGDVANKKILDVGAGTGRLSVRLSALGADMFALDVSDKMLGVLKDKNKKIKIVFGDAEDIPFPNNTFDFVIAAFLIVHLKDPSKFFDEAYRILKDDGKLIVTNINQKDPPEVKTKEGVIKIKSFYHRPDDVVEKLRDMAFGIEKNLTITEKDQWVNQIVVAVK
jgi:ubiquinone/menaquinone biosynthesis C-methylase UbiE